MSAITTTKEDQEKSLNDRLYKINAFKSRVKSLKENELNLMKKHNFLLILNIHP